MRVPLQGIKLRNTRTHAPESRAYSRRGGFCGRDVSVARRGAGMCGAREVVGGGGVAGGWPGTRRLNKTVVSEINSFIRRVRTFA